MDYQSLSKLNGNAFTRVAKTNCGICPHASLIVFFISNGGQNWNSCIQSCSTGLRAALVLARFIDNLTSNHSEYAIIMYVCLCNYIPPEIFPSPNLLLEYWNILPWIYLEVFYQLGYGIVVPRAWLFLQRLMSWMPASGCEAHATQFIKICQIAVAPFTNMV